MKLSYLLFVLCSNWTLSECQTGQPAPDFEVTDTHGKKHRLYDYLNHGKTVVLDFFFTTCIPCQYYTPQVNLAFKKYGCNKKDVIFMAIDYNDTNEEVKAYDSKYQIEYPSISGLEGGGNKVVNAYGIIGFPTFYVVDSSKKIVMEIDPPTLQVFDFRFNQLGLIPQDCELNGIANDLAIRSQKLNSNLVLNNYLLLESQEPISFKQSLVIYNSMGIEVQSKASIEPYTSSFLIPMVDLAPGQYYCTLRAENGTPMALLPFIKL